MGGYSRIKRIGVLSCLLEVKKAIVVPLRSVQLLKADSGSFYRAFKGIKPLTTASLKWRLGA